MKIEGIQAISASDGFLKCQILDIIRFKILSESIRN